MTRSLANPILLVFFLSIGLTLGFIPTTTYIAKAILELTKHPTPILQKWVEIFLFPALAALFFVSSGVRRHKKPPFHLTQYLTLCALPWILAFLSGFYISRTPFLNLISSQQGLQNLAWYWIAVPLGEEILFRGWMFHIFETFYKDTNLTATNPLPLTVWMPAFSFALWHFQNLPIDGLGFTVFQVSYTFFVGLWLGLLRWRFERLSAPIFAHILLNLVSGR